MRTVNIAELKNKLSAYITYAKAGEEIIIRERNRPVARLVPFIADNLSDENLELIALGIIRPAKNAIDWEAFDKLPKTKLMGEALTKALLDEREEGR